MSRSAPRVARFILLLTALLLSACQPAQVTPQPTPQPTPRSTRQPVEERVNILPEQASLNGRSLPLPAPAAFRFLVVGHLYGSNGSNDQEPAKAVLDQFPALERLNLSLWVSLGDMVRQSRDDDFAAFERLFLQRVRVPVFNTPGNHDVQNRTLYQEWYGPTYYSFIYGPAAFIFLDTEIETCAVTEPQRSMLQTALQAALQAEGVSSIFIFMHKTLFLKNDVLFALDRDQASPNDWICYNNAGFPLLLDELILPAAARKPVYLFAGDVGAEGNLSPWFEQRAGQNLTLVMTGLGDRPTDAGILVTVDASGARLELYPLAGARLPPLQSFTPAYWEAYAASLPPSPTPQK